MPPLAARANLDQIGFLLGRAYYSYIGLLQRRLDEEGLSTYLKPGMGSLLFALFREDNRRFTEVSAELQIAKSTMTGMVVRMRKAGLLTVERDNHDGRALRLRLTRRARSLEPRCQQLAVQMEVLLGRKLSNPRREILRRSLVLVTKTIAESLESPSSKKQFKQSYKSEGTKL